MKFNSFVLLEMSVQIRLLGELAPTSRLTARKLLLLCMHFPVLLQRVQKREGVPTFLASEFSVSVFCPMNPKMSI